MQIFIPTRDRIPLQFTWKNLTPELRACATLVCPAEEVQSHQDRGRRALARPPLRLAAVRQWLVDEVADQSQPVIMLDDDLSFFYRAEPDKHNLLPITPRRLNSLFERLNEYVDSEEYAHAGLSPRQFNNTLFPATEIRTTRMNAVHCVDPRVLKKHGIRYDDVDMMEDYHVTLSLFRKGEDNVVIADHAWDQNRGSGAEGGFAHFRTKETQAAAAERLAQLHPDFVKVVTKKPKTGQGEVWGGERVDVAVRWTDAFRSGKYVPLFKRK